MKNDICKPTIPINFSSREKLLSANSELIGQLQARLKSKRFKPQDGDGVKLAYVRVFVQALQVQNSILKDNELDEIQKRIEALESTQTNTGCSNPVYAPVFEAIE
jgi:hypothetical protein